MTALLWDMDGLLVDSEPVWTIAEDAVCAIRGGVFTPELKARMVGHRLDAAVLILADGLLEQGIVADPAELADELLVRMVELFQTELRFCDGALDLLAEARRRGLPCAIVSSSFRVLVDAVTATLPPETFAVAIGGDEVTHAKPHPEPYLRAASMLGVAPEHCLVLEDSPTGMRSAIAAGCRAVMVPSVAGVAIDPDWTVLQSLRELAL